MHSSETNELRHVRSSLTSSRSQTPHNVPNAALSGALLAFSKPGSKQDVLLTQHHGALSAASRAQSVNDTSRGVAIVAAPPALTPAYTGSSTHSSYFGLNKENSGQRQELTPDLSRSVSYASTPVPFAPLRPAVDSRSASFTAATLAAARHRSTTPSRTLSDAAISGAQIALDPRASALQRRLDERRIARELDGSMDGEDARERPDMTSIEPTKSLISIFEQQSGSNRPPAARQISLAKGKPPPILAPKPQRTVSVHQVSPELPRTDVTAKSKPVPLAKPTQNGTALGNERPSTAKGAVETAPKTLTPRPNLPPPRRAARRSIGELRDIDTSSAPPQQLSRFGLPLPSSSKPTPRPPSVAPGARGRATPSNPRRTSPTYKDESLHMLSPHLTGDSLANAIVGANLALKSPSPARRARTPPPLPGPRRKQHHHGIDMLQGARARSLSPQKKQPGRMLTTLRGDEAEEKLKHKKHHFRNPNKHHEGTRERWRDFVSEPERKRYEGVWAANKGLYIPHSGQADEVLNLVVRDIWSRSRLPNEKLGMVWDLVAVDEEDETATNGKKRRSLTREQFVVGLWLIDQVLKGRNLPHSVNASVWSSVRLIGVKVRLEGKGKDGRKLERGTAW